MILAEVAATGTQIYLAAIGAVSAVMVATLPVLVGIKRQGAATQEQGKATQQQLFPAGAKCVQDKLDEIQASMAQVAVEVVAAQGRIAAELTATKERLAAELVAAQAHQATYNANVASTLGVITARLDQVQQSVDRRRVGRDIPPA